MGVDFYLANNKKSISLSTECVGIEEELHIIIWKINKDFKLNLNILADLDPYGEKVFSSAELEMLIYDCSILTNRLSDNNLIEEIILMEHIQKQDISKILKISEELKNIIIKANDSLENLIYLGD